MRRLAVWVLGLLLLGCGGGHDAEAKSIRVQNGSSASTITPSVSVARTTCISPCYVFFDSTATTSTQTTNAFHDIDVAWNFGDPSSGTWSKGARAGVSSKNVAYGAVAGHVYETALGSGTTVFAPSVSLYDGATTSIPAVSTISVTDPDSAPEFAGTRTLCVSNDADFTGCPAGATQQTVATSWATAIGNVCTTVGGNVVKRLLFKRGHTWNALNNASKACAGPVLIGAFGTGAKPVWTLDATFPVGTTNLLRLGNSLVNSSNDWRIMDIRVDGSAVPYPRRQAAFWALGQFDQYTFLRIEYVHMNLGLEISESIVAINERTQPGQHVHQQIAVVDTAIITPADTNNTHDYFSAEKFFYAGNDIDTAGVDGQVTKSHNLRITHGYKGVISNNSFANPGGTNQRHHLKLHGHTWVESSVGAGDWAPAMLETTNANVHPDNASGGAVNFPMTTSDAGGKTKYVVVSDNKATTGAGNKTGWYFTMSPPDATNNNRLEDILAERNWCVAGPATSGLGYQYCFETNGERFSLRNNLIDATQGVLQGGFLIWRRHAGAPNSDIWVYNNTGYSNFGPSADVFIPINTGSAGATTGVVLKNNLLYSPGDNTGSFFSDAGTGSVVSHNSGTVGTIQSDPVFTLTPPVSFGDYLPTGANYSKDTGTSVKVFRDFNGTLRTGTTDLGAFTQ